MPVRRRLHGLASLMMQLVSRYNGGAAQLVLLGAGFDSRPYRLGIGRAREYSSWISLRHRNERFCGIEARYGSSAKSVVYIPVDFQTQTVDSALQAKGFDQNALSLVLWEGVLNYLSEGAVNVTLRSVAKSVAPGSAMVFTYVHRGLLDGSVEFAGGAQILEQLAAAREPVNIAGSNRGIFRHILRRADGRSSTICQQTSIAPGTSAPRGG